MTRAMKWIRSFFISINGNMKGYCGCKVKNITSSTNFAFLSIPSLHKIHNLQYHTFSVFSSLMKPFHLTICVLWVPALGFQVNTYTNRMYSFKASNAKCINVNYVLDYRNSSKYSTRDSCSEQWHKMNYYQRPKRKSLRKILQTYQRMKIYPAGIFLQMSRTDLHSDTNQWVSAPWNRTSNRQLQKDSFVLYLSMKLYF